MDGEGTVLIAPGPAGFVRRDREILERLDTTEMLYSTDAGEIARAVRRRQRVVVWFVERHAFTAVRVARRLGRPTLVILGGQEGASCDWCAYGLWRARWDVRVRAVYAMHNATRLWAVEPSLAFHALAHAGLSPRSHDVEIVHTVFDADEFRPVVPKTLDVAWGAVSETRRKRFELIEKALAGSGMTHIRVGDWSPSNYAHVLARARVVVNASHHEGLNNTLCEAMLAGAVPVVTSIAGNLHAVDGLPDARVVPWWEDASALASEILAACDAWTPEAGARAREHVLERFPVSAREDAFRRFLEVES
jgi:glycosyltransferase involved in cell wall biosynthesis